MSGIELVKMADLIKSNYGRVPPAVPVSSNDAAFLTYTSGTTGEEIRQKKKRGLDFLNRTIQGSY